MPDRQPGSLSRSTSLRRLCSCIVPHRPSPGDPAARHTPRTARPAPTAPASHTPLLAGALLGTRLAPLGSGMPNHCTEPREPPAPKRPARAAPLTKRGGCVAGSSQGKGGHPPPHGHPHPHARTAQEPPAAGSAENPGPVPHRPQRQRLQTPPQGASICPAMLPSWGTGRSYQDTQKFCLLP